jgi:hypothetical protein
MEWVKSDRLGFDHQNESVIFYQQHFSVKTVQEKCYHLHFDQKIDQEKSFRGDWVISTE